MACSNCSRGLIGKPSLSVMKSAVKARNHSPLLNASATMPSQRLSNSSRPARRFPSFNRTSVYKLGCVQSLKPLHSVVATARMISYLSIDSRNCGSISMSALCCNTHGP